MSHGSLWVARPEAAGGDGILVRLDPRTGHVQRLFRALPGTYDLASELDGTVWSGGTFGEVNRIDPVTNEVIRADTEGRNYSVAAGDGSAWTAVSGGTVTGNNLVKRTVSFAAYATDRIRINVTNAMASSSRITEIEAWGY